MTPSTPTNRQAISGHRATLACAVGIAAAALAGCGSGTRQTTADAAPPSPPPRPLVISSASQLGDLYWNGQLNDSHGYRWDVAFIPGIAPTAKVMARSYVRSWGHLRDFGTTSDGSDSSAMSAYRFAVSDCVGDFMLHGVHRDYSQTNADIAELWQERPFTWYAQVPFRMVWGYLLKPVGRVAFGSVGAVAGLAGGTAFGAVEGSGRAVWAVGDAGVAGTLYPLGRVVWQQPVYLLSIFNAEPDLKQDGSWGLHVISWRDPKNPDAPVSPYPPPKPETLPPATAQAHTGS